MILRKKTLQIAVNITLCVIAVLPFNLFSQKIDKIYGENITGDDSAFYRDFANCKSNTDYTAGVYAIKKGSKFKMRFVNFNSSGNITICRDIEPIGQNTEFHPFDIKPLKNNSGYIIVGYTKRLNGILPLICKIDNLGNPITTKEIWNGGFFSRVIELSNGNFVCCGSHTGTTQPIAAVRNAFYACFDANFNLLNTQIIIGASATIPFDNFNDLVEVDNQEIIITGTVTEISSILGGPSSRLTIARLNPSSGAVLWQTNPLLFNIGSPKIGILGDTLLIFGNAESPYTSFVIGLNKNNGNLITFEFIEANTTTGCTNTLLLHIPFFTGIFKKDQNTLYLTGKLKTPSGEHNFIGEFDNLTHTFSNNFAYETVAFNYCTDFTCYTLHPTTGSPNPLAISSINNTAQINHSELCTVTYNSNNSIPSSSHDKNKLWIYNNQSSTVHGQSSFNFSIMPENLPNSVPLNWENYYITNINTINTNSSLVLLNSLDCSFNFPCPCHD
jgi:hypothetical protein